MELIWVQRIPVLYWLMLLVVISSWLIRYLMQLRGLVNAARDAATTVRERAAEIRAMIKSKSASDAGLETDSAKDLGPPAQNVNDGAPLKEMTRNRRFIPGGHWSFIPDICIKTILCVGLFLVLKREVVLSINGKNGSAVQQLHAQTLEGHLQTARQYAEALHGHTHEIGQSVLVNLKASLQAGTDLASLIEEPVVSSANPGTLRSFLSNYGGSKFVAGSSELPLGATIFSDLASSYSSRLTAHSCYAVMQADCNFVVYSLNSGRVVWASNTASNNARVGCSASFLFAIRARELRLVICWLLGLQHARTCIPILKRHIKAHHIDRLLTGRLALHLTATGFDIVGANYNESLVKFAQPKAQSHPDNDDYHPM
jgi:hypothetical protein